MKKLIYLMVGLAVLLTGCDRYSSDNGDLDGFWLLTQADTLATGGSADLRTRQLTYSVYTDLLQLRGSGTEILMRFRHTADSLTVYEPYTGGWCQPDYVLEDVSLLYPYGIRRLREGFRVETLSGSRLVLRSAELRLHLRKY